MSDSAQPQVGAPTPPRSGSSATINLADKVRSFVNGPGQVHNTHPAGQYARSEAGGYEVRAQAANQIAKRLRSGAHKRGLIGGTLSMVAAAYVSRYQQEMAGHQKMFEMTARAKRGDFEGMTTVDIRHLEEHAHKYGTPHVEAVKAAAAGELIRREEIRQREKRSIRHGNMAEDHAIRANQNEQLHERRMRQRDELHNQQMLQGAARNQARGGAARAQPGQPSNAHAPLSEVMTNAQHNNRRVETSKLQRLAQAQQAAHPTPFHPVFKGKMPLAPRTPGATAPSGGGQQSHMVAMRGKKGGMIEKNTVTGKMHYLGRKAASQKRTRANIDAAKARLRGAG